MKISYIFVALAILLVVGCAQTTPPETPPVTETPPVEEAPVEEMPPVEEAPEPTAAEIEILVRVYDPEELTVTKGTTVKWINTAPGVRILGGAVKSPKLESGDTFEYTFNEVGEYTIIGVISKARGKVIVVEELPEATE